MVYVDIKSTTLKRIASNEAILLDIDQLKEVENFLFFGKVKILKTDVFITNNSDNGLTMSEYCNVIIM